MGRLDQALGAASGLFGQRGIDPAQAAEKLAALLPQVIDQLTPGANVPAGGDLVAKGLAPLKSRVSG